MRTLATISFSFATVVLCAVLLPWSGWHLYAAAALAATAVAAFFLRNRRKGGVRMVLILSAAAAGLLYFTGYQALLVRPMTALCGEETRPFSAEVTEYAVPTTYGAKVTVRLGVGVKAAVYGDESILELAPGQRISGTARWQDAARIRETSITTFTARGVFVLLYQKGELTVEPGRQGSPVYWPARCARAVREKIDAIWDDPVTAAFMRAELTGDRSAIAEEENAAVSQVGLAHLFAVSGLHCAFLVTLMGLLIPTGSRKVYGAVTAAVLLFYMVMVGMTPSVVRACIMQIFLLAAPLFRRDSDPLTALAAALWVLLLANPYAVGGISLQLSFAATLGLILLSGRIYGILTGWYKGRRRGFRRLLAFAAANVSACLSALVFTIPLTAYYFNNFTIISPLSNLLATPVAGWNFMAGSLTVAAGFMWLPAARVLGWVCWAMVHYVLLVSRLLMRLPYHALYFTNRYMKYWLTYVYLLLGICCFTRGNRRRYVLAAALAAASLVLTVGLNNREYRYGTMNAIVVNVGQGECVIFYSGDEAVIVDCGSGNSYIRAGGRAADQLGSIGIHRLSALVLTHYHADHTSGVYELLARVPVERMYLPDIEDEFGVRDRILDLAGRYGTEVFFVRGPETEPVGETMMTIYPPVGAGDMNEQGLTILCSAGDFDLLITGDMAGSTEKKLIETWKLPDVEVLMVSHHGSKYSSSREFLEEIRPDTAIISVGDNSYGHPTQEAMARLHAAGAEIYRTDEQGTILVTVHGGEN